MKLIRIFGDTKYESEIVGYSEDLENTEIVAKIENELNIDLKDVMVSPKGTRTRYSNDDAGITLIIEEIEKFN